MVHLARHHWTLLTVGCFALAVAYGFRFVNGIEAMIGFLLVGLVSGLLLRSWWAVPILAIGMFSGSIVRIFWSAGTTLSAPTTEAFTLGVVGEVLIGSLMAYVPLGLFLCAPVGIGKWFGDRQLRRLGS